MKIFFTFIVMAVSIASFAQDHSSHSSHGPQEGIAPAEMQAMKQDMQKKMRAEKTAEERQALMTEQQKLMQNKHGHVSMGTMSH